MKHYLSPLTLSLFLLASGCGDPKTTFKATSSVLIGADDLKQGATVEGEMAKINLLAANIATNANQSVEIARLKNTDLIRITVADPNGVEAARTSNRILESYLDSGTFGQMVEKAFPPKEPVRR